MYRAKIGRVTGLILVFAVVIGMILLVGCPGEKPAGDEDNESNGGEAVMDKGEQVGDEGAVEMEADGTDMAGEDEEREAEAEDNGGEQGEPEEEEEEKFTPTQEEPLAPPADAAVGTPDVPPGDLALVVSLKGRGDPVPLDEGAVVEVANSLDVQCTVVNNTLDTVEITFANAQKLDVMVTDSEGNLVYRWSDGRRFAQVVNTLELTSGEYWAHEITIPIGEGDRMLPEGNYVFTVLLTGDPMLTATASDVLIRR